MTKLRDPVTIEAALDAIGVLIGWDRVAEICSPPGKSIGARRARKWGDPDEPDRLPAMYIVPLDLAYVAAGGGCHILHDTIGRMLDIASAPSVACAIALSKRTEVAIVEVAQSHAALIVANRPGACPGARADAARQVEEGVEALSATLPLLLAESQPEKGGE